MFGLFKKKKQQTEALTEKEERSHSDNGAADIAARTASNHATQIQMQKAAEKAAKPSDYTGNRNLYDSEVAKRRAKDQAFANGQRPVDPYLKTELFRTIEEARIAHPDTWPYYVAEIDHTFPVEKIFEMLKNNPFLTNDDIRDIVNCNDNLSVMSRRINNAKRNRTNQELVDAREYREGIGLDLSDEAEESLISNGTKAENAVAQKAQKRTNERVLELGHEAGMAGAEYAGVTGLTMSGINNVTALLNGEKSAEEAIADTVAQSGKAAVDGYVMSSSLTVLGRKMSSSSSEFIRNLADANVPGKVVTAVMVTGDTLTKWGSGEITTQECMIELGDKGLNMATMGYFMAMGQAAIPIPIVGGAIGAMVGSTLTSGYYQELIHILKDREVEHQERMRLIAESEQAAEETRQFNEQLRQYRDRYFAECHEFFDTTISTMQFAYETGDADGVIHAANKITEKLGGKVQYETVDEFEDFLDSDEPFVL
mgnify:FL=1